MNKAYDWNENSYKNLGLKAQRNYPNEELMRFIGREVLNQVLLSQRSEIMVLEIGCGSCSNLWALAKEGLSCYGIDISDTAILLGKETLEKWGVNADIKKSDMRNTGYDSEFFDIVLDVFSIYSINHIGFLQTLDEVERILKKGGLFFSYTPSSKSKAFNDFSPAKKIDGNTLNGIYRKNSPFYGNFYDFHFIESYEYKKILENKGFKIIYLETISKTYNNLQEEFQFVSIVAQKN